MRNVIFKPSVLEERLKETLEHLATFNRFPELGGVTREVFTPEYLAAERYVASLMEDVGLIPRKDAFGNLFGRWEAGKPEAPVVLTGSHFDTTLNAGKYDGTVGVVGAIEAIRLLKEEGFNPARAIEVVAFAGEEPRFGVGCIGSRAMMGRLSQEDLDLMRDRDQVSLAQVLREIKLDPTKLEEARLSPASIHAFVELHIEQAAVLERQGFRVGVVRKIAAPHDLLVRIKGEALHSGSTPMSMRKDALTGAAKAILALEELASESRSGTTVGTVGVMRLRPGAINIIPGEVEMEVDIRDSDSTAREAVVESFLEALHKICANKNLVFSVKEMVIDEPRECSKEVVEAAEGACQQLGVKFLSMTSGAYHDAMVLGKEVPMGMIFIPSEGGVSHSPEEYTSYEDIALGVEVLAKTIARLSRI